MEVVAESVAGIDVHQKQITVTVLIGDANSAKPKRVSKRFETITSRLKECGEWLKELQVAQVLMESTGQYWRPVWQVLEPFGFKMILCNPRIIKNIPGKKTDQKDSEWLSELARYGLVSASYVPPRKIQELRESTRLRKSYTQSMTRIKNEVHNILQRSNIKLTTYVSDIFSGSGLKLLTLILDGEVITPQTVSKCMHGRMKASPEQITASMDGILTVNDHRLMVLNMRLLASYQVVLNDLNIQIEEQVAEFKDLYLRLQDIPGISERTAQIVLAEIGIDVSPFPDAHHLASWAGLCPGNYESVGVKHGAKTLHGNVYLKNALITAAMGAKLTKDSSLKDYFWRVQSRAGAAKARTALAHKLTRIIGTLSIGVGN
jgi:transposase